MLDRREIELGKVSVWGVEAKKKRVRNAENRNESRRFTSRMRNREGGPGQPNEIKETCLFEHICENGIRNDDL